MGLKKRSRRHERTAQPDKRASVDLHIDELVLHGFSPRDRYRIAGAVESELARLITDRGLPFALRQDADIGSLEGNDIDLPAGTRPDVAGKRVAHEVYRRMEK
jgi:hypothetical protein